MVKETIEKELTGTRRRMSHQTDNAHKDTEIIKRNEIEIQELKSTITKRGKITRNVDQQHF